MKSLFSKFALPLIGNYDPVSLQILCRKYESWLKINLQKSLIMVNLSLCVMFFGWDTVKIGIIRAKAQFSVWI